MSLTAEAELVLDPEKKYEIVNGQPEEKEMAGALHSGVGSRLIIRLGVYAETHKLGAVYGADATYQIGLNERLPDVSFISASRLPQDGEPTTKWMIVPDLAVEVISPNDLYGKVKSKIHEYLAAGVREVWIVEPEFKMITIYRSPTDFTVFAEDDELVSEAVLPGFRLKLSELFQLPDFS
jgi:Uma2 family endonuclease